MKYIHDHIYERLELSELAEAFGYSKWHLCVKFRAYTGKSLSEYIRHYRMQLAALDVLSGKKIIETALDCGYDSVSGFNKAFLAEHGCLPREYKKRAKESRLYYERRQSEMFHLR